MIGFYTLVLAIGIAFSSFLITSYQGFSGFEKKTSALINYDTTALASASRVAKESSQFLTDLQAGILSESNVILSESNVILSEAKDPVDLLNELIHDLQAHSGNQLSRTISYGLKNKEDYKIKLMHSSYIPTKLTKNDIAYTSTIIEEEVMREAGNPVEIESTRDLEGFIDSGKLKISEELLEQLFSAAQVPAIISQQESLGLEVSAEGLRLEDLPNALNLELNRDVILKPSLRANEESVAIQAQKYLSRTAVAQIRIGKVEEVLPPPDEDGDDPVDDPIDDSVDTPVIPPAVTPIEISRLELAISVVPFTERGFLYEPSKPIDINNPLQIINKKEGGYSSIFKRADGYLQISIGSITTKPSSNKLVDYFNTKDLSFDTVTLNFEEAVDQSVILSAAKDPKTTVVKNEKVDLDIAPRGRTTYTTAAKDFTVNGVLIPKGSVIVAVRKSGVEERLAELGEYEHFRVYDPKTGNLISNFGDNAIKAAGCLGGTQCLDIKQFAQAKGTTDHGQDIYYSFSLEELIPGSSAFSATQAWTKIQKDLEEKLQGDINAKKEEWMQEELKKLNEARKIYIGVDSIDRASDADLEEMSSYLKTGNMTAFEKKLGITDKPLDLDPRYFNDYERSLLQTQWQLKNKALKDFAEAKLGLWDAERDFLDQREGSIDDDIAILKDARTHFINTWDSYNADKKLYSAIDKLDPVAEAEKKAAAEKRKKELETKKQSLNTEIKQLENKRKATNTEITSLEAKIKDLKKAVKDLAGKKKQQAEYEKKKANMDKKLAELASLQKYLSGIKTQLASKEAELKQVKSELNSL